MRVHLTSFPKCPLSGTNAGSMSAGVNNTNRARVIPGQMYTSGGCKCSFQAGPGPCQASDWPLRTRICCWASPARGAPRRWTHSSDLPTLWQQEMLHPHSILLLTPDRLYRTRHASWSLSCSLMDVWLPECCPEPGAQRSASSFFPSVLRKPVQSLPPGGSWVPASCLERSGCADSVGPCHERPRS